MTEFEDACPWCEYGVPPCTCMDDHEHDDDGSYWDDMHEEDEPETG